MLFVFDAGNALIKCYTPSKNKLESFAHHVAWLSDNKWQQVLSDNNGTPPPGIVRIHSEHIEPLAVAFGDAAVRHQVVELPKGAERYTRDYYGALLAYSLSEALQRTNKQIALYASHAPGDTNYKVDLKMAAQGFWQVESRYGILEFNVTDVQTFEEPFGGYANVALTKDGYEHQRNPLRGKTVLVIDVGGYTVDTLAIEKSGAIDRLSIQSVYAGVLDMLHNFLNEIKTNNRALFKNTRKIDPRRVESALMTGLFQFGNKPIECRNESREQRYVLGNEVRGIVDSLGGPANFDIALVTGGGGALLHATLQELMPNLDFLLAESNIDHMHYANVLGGAKLANALQLMEG